MLLLDPVAVAQRGCSAVTKHASRRNRKLVGFAFCEEPSSSTVPDPVSWNSTVLIDIVSVMIGHASMTRTRIVLHHRALALAVVAVTPPQSVQYHGESDT